jgi:hypothetical protein
VTDHLDSKANPADHVEPKAENPLLSLLLNIVLPVIVLTRLSDVELLGPVIALVIATALPLGYGIYDYIQRREINLFSSLGVISVVLTGSLGLLKANAIAIAVKEGLIPLVLGGAFVLSARTETPLLRKLLLTPQVMDVKAIDHYVKKNEKESDFDQLLWRSSLLMGLAMLVASVLSFLVAIYPQKRTGHRGFRSGIGPPDLPKLTRRRHPHADRRRFRLLVSLPGTEENHGAGRRRYP